MGIALKNHARDPDLPFQPLNRGRSPLPSPALPHLGPALPGLKVQQSGGQLSHSTPRPLGDGHFPNKLRPTPLPGEVTVSVAAQIINPTPSQNPTRYPGWVQLLIWTHHSICVVTVTLVITTLGFYGQSVYYQRQWGQHYQQLQHLQTMEQQGLAAIEMMKQTLLDQAEAPGFPMQAPLPGTAVKVQKASPRSLKGVEPTTPDRSLELDAPMGY